MTNSKSKKKSRKKCQQKIKLRGGRTLKKGLNLTDLSFKAKKIIIREQELATTDDHQEPTSKRRKKLRDILALCNHHNSTARKDAIEGLKEIVQENREIIVPNLGQIIQHLLPLCSDDTGSVRASAAKLLEMVFERVREEDIKPHLYIISTCISYLMTHNQSDVQADSLVVMDLFLEKYPNYVLNSSNQLITNFLELISRKRGGRGGSNARTLNVDPESKLSSQYWRAQVVKRLEKLLKTIQRHVFQEQSMESFPTSKEIHWTEKRSSDFRILGFQRELTTSYVLSPEVIETRTPIAFSLLKDEKTLQNFIDTLIPLLTEMWVEVMPSKVDRVKNNKLSHESLGVLETVASITNLLYECVESYANSRNNSSLIIWFQTKYSKEIVRRFYSNFPYATENLKKAQKTKEATPDLNITLCKGLVSQAMLVNAKAKGSNVLGEACRLICSKLANEPEALQIEDMEIIIGFIQRLSEVDGYYESLQDLLKSCLVGYSRLHVLQTKRAFLLRMFTELYVKSVGRNKRICDLLSDTLMNLPEELQSQETVHGQVIKSLLSLAPLGNPVFLSIIQSNLAGILAKLPHLKVSAMSEMEGKIMIIRLIFWVPNLSPDLNGEIERSLANSSFNDDLRTSLLHILEARKLKLN